MKQLTLDSWADFAQTAPATPPPPPPAPSPPSVENDALTPGARARARARARRAQRAPHLPLSSSASSLREEETSTVDERPAVDFINDVTWTLSAWLREGPRHLRDWLPSRLCVALRPAACVERDDCSEGWTVTVLRPRGRDGASVSSWTGGGFGALDPVPDPKVPPVEGERRIRRGDQRVFRLREVQLPHPPTVDAAKVSADQQLARIPARARRGA